MSSSENELIIPNDHGLKGNETKLKTPAERAHAVIAYLRKDHEHNADWRQFLAPRGNDIGGLVVLLDLTKGLEKPSLASEVSPKLQGLWAASSLELKRLLRTETSRVRFYHHKVRERQRTEPHIERI